MRVRSTQAQLRELDDVIIQVVEDNAPITLRGVYYRVLSVGAVAKTEPAYRKVGREVKRLRETGDIAYEDIADGTRWTIQPQTYDSAQEAARNTAAVYRRKPVARPAGRRDDLHREGRHHRRRQGVTRELQVPLGILRGYSSLRSRTPQRPASPPRTSRCTCTTWFSRASVGVV
ncbi:hypothetical protein [Streptomyces coeruleorubidus]|uniref:hypothetical protein n=1 Tax=Streptomyces coeruleorubidus TaxID=116188 RepID=UPI0037B7A3B5